jgi:hypothetical protein
MVKVPEIVKRLGSSADGGEKAQQNAGLFLRFPESEA